MKQVIKIFLLIALTASVTSCKNDKYETVMSDRKMDIKKVESRLASSDFKYMDLVSLWKIDANGDFNQIKKIDDFNFTAIYKPYSILTLEESENPTLEETVTDAFKQKLMSYNNVHVLNFSIQNKTFKNELLKLDIEDNQAYYDRITYYSFSVKNDAFMIEGKDTLKCDFVNFERTYEANPSIMMSLSFTRKSSVNVYNNLKLVFEDKIFNKGKLIFNFNTQPILLLNYLKPLS